MQKHLSLSFLLSLLLATSTLIQAQISSPGIPHTFKTKLQYPISLIDLIKTPALNHKKIATEDAQNEADNLPPRFGYTFDVEHSLENSGTWIPLPNGDRLWRLRIHCPEARSINLTYSDFYLPKGATFYLYNPDRSKVLGAFTSFNNHPSRTFATNVIEDERIFLEYYEPAAVKGKGRITIDRIVHGYRFIRSIKLEKGFNDSGPCNVNINCPEGDDWQDQKKSVARIIMIGSLCSGALVNNQAQDCKPYFLTANHCTSGFSAAQMNQFIFQFNYESPNCTNINGPTNESVTGASLKANLAASDFALLELNSEPPPEYNVYYSGWNNINSPASSVTGIHHPAGDIKKICIENQAVTTSGNEWRVDDWDVGVTEGGSSGSPLYDPDKRIVGQLFGGSAACAGTNDNGQPDFYGKFSHSWGAGGSASNQLKDWLDPNDTGVTTLDGRYCDDPYCETAGNTGNPFISNVTVNGTANDSGNDGGYGDYKNVTFTVTQGANNSVSLEPNNNANRFWRIWIDFNGDEDLENAGEMVFEASGNGTVTGNLNLPDCVNNIDTRMRVSMRNNQFPDVCDTGFNGEVEDYTVTLISSEADNYDFTATPTTGLAPVTVQFTPIYTGTDGNTAEDFTWSWSFAEGTPATSNLPNPSVTYDTGGNFNVSVNVTNTAGCTFTISKSNYINISDYCSTQGNIITDEWIGRVAIADIDNSTGADGGYGNYTNISTDLFLGETYEITLEPEFAADTFNEFWRVWIDYNRDGDFGDAGELAFDAGTATSAPVSGDITIPTTVQQGQTRMRVSMKYNDDTGAPNPCETFTWGEVEDYSVFLTTPDACNLSSNLTFSNTNYTYYNVNWNASPDATAYNLRYRAAGQANWTDVFGLSGNSYIATPQAPCTTYEWQIQAICGTNISDYSGSFFNTTLGCAETYCLTYGDGRETWVETVTFNGFINNSGQDYGYGNFSNFKFNVLQNNNYNIALTPKSNAQAETIYWKVWIDYNRDQVFDPFNELAYSTSNLSNTTVFGTVNILSFASIGDTRMRISMSTDSNAQPCDLGTDEGEVEDYTLTISAETVNTPPVALQDAFTTHEDEALTMNVLANDQDAEGSTLTVDNFSPTANGTLTLQDDGQFLYEPNPNFNGEDKFSYQASDGNGGLSDLTLVDIEVLPVNDAPIALADERSTNEDTPLTIQILSNDSDVDGDVLQIENFEVPSNGTLQQEGMNLVYTPKLNFFGMDEFNYTISDGNFAESSALATINVLPVNDLPIAVDDLITTDENTPVTVAVLNNDQDFDGDALQIEAFNQAANGTVEQTGQSLQYTPNMDFIGSDEFEYTMNDGNGESATAMVRINVIDLNSAPQALGDEVETQEDTPISFNVFANDSDPDNDELSIETFTQTQNGLVVQTGMDFTYIPHENFFGTDEFTYQLKDATGTVSNFATVAIRVWSVNDEPIAVDDEKKVTEDVAGLVSVLKNDIDVDDISLKIEDFSQAANGTVDKIGTTILRYTPNPDFDGTDEYTYTIRDAKGAVSNTATVRITMLPANDLPQIMSDQITTEEDTPVAFDVRANDVDADGDALTIAAYTETSNGTLTQEADGSFTYSPKEHFHGSDSFTYQITDGNGEVSGSATVSIEVVPVNDLPQLAEDIVETNEDEAVTFEVLNNDSDIDGDALQLTEFTATANGILTQNGNELTYTPNENFNGQDEFIYTASDDKGGSATAKVTLIVFAVNDLPLSRDDQVTTAENTPVSVAVLENDSDLDGDNLDIISFKQGDNGSVSKEGLDLVYTPNENFNGSDQFTYTATDNNGGTANATVFVTVTSTNQSPLAVADEFSTEEDTQADFNVLQNDSDPDGDALQISNFTSPANGTLEVLPDQSMRYTPNENYFGTDGFQYQSTDGNGSESEMVEVKINVLPVNDAPVGMGDIISLDEDTSIDIAVLENDMDVEAEVLSIDSFSSTSHGTLEQMGNELRYTPDEHYFGADAFDYQVRDASGAVSEIINVSIQVQAVPDPPTVPVLLTPEHESMVSMEENPLHFTWEASTDPDNETLEYTVILIRDSDGEEILNTTTTETFYEMEVALLQPESLYKWIVTTSDGLFTAASANFEFQTSEIVDIEVIDAESGTILGQNLPNPFQASTKIPFYLPQAAAVQLEVFDLTGKRVAVLLEGERESGWHEVDFVVDELASGVYWYRLKTEEVVLGRRMLVGR